MKNIEIISAILQQVEQYPPNPNELFFSLIEYDEEEISEQVLHLLDIGVIRISNESRLEKANGQTRRLDGNSKRNTYRGS